MHSCLSLVVEIITAQVKDTGASYIYADEAFTALAKDVAKAVPTVKVRYIFWLGIGRVGLLGDSVHS